MHTYKRYDQIYKITKEPFTKYTYTVDDKHAFYFCHMRPRLTNEKEKDLVVVVKDFDIKAVGLRNSETEFNSFEEMLQDFQKVYNLYHKQTFLITVLLEHADSKAFLIASIGPFRLKIVPHNSSFTLLEFNSDINIYKNNAVYNKDYFDIGEALKDVAFLDYRDLLGEI